MPILTGEGTSEQASEYASSLLTQPDLSLNKNHQEATAEKLYSDLLEKVAARRKDFLIAATTLKSPKTWRPGGEYQYSLKTGTLQIKLGKNYVSGHDAIITFLQDRDSEQIVETAKFESPHLGRGSLNRAYQNAGLAFTSRPHQLAGGVEFYLDRGELIRELKGRQGRISTNYRFPENFTGQQYPEITQIFTPDVIEDSDLKTITATIGYPGNTLEVKSLFESKETNTVRGYGSHTVIFGLGSEDIPVKNSYISFWGKGKEGVAANGSNVLLFTSEAVDRMQRVISSIPTRIDVPCVYRNIADNKFALASMWAPNTV